VANDKRFTRKNITLKAGIENCGKDAHWKRDKNLRDILVHLYEWHELLLNFVKNGMAGKNAPFLPKPYSPVHSVKLLLLFSLNYQASRTLNWCAIIPDVSRA
jgi:hypothetical protein